MTSVLGTILVFGFVILAHEFGHFVVARRLGVAVQRFSVGVGPSIWAFRAGETEYRIGILPLGGYVKLAGQEPGTPVPPELTGRTYPELRPQWRSAILLAGPAANVLLTWLIFGAVFAVFGVARLLPIVGSVADDSPASAAGLEVGDRIAAIDDHAVEQWSDLGERLSGKEGQQITLTWIRAGQHRKADVVPHLSSVEDANGERVERAVIGVTPAGDTAIDDVSVPRAALLGAKETWQVAKGSLVVLYRLITGQASLSTIAGPVGIAQISSEAAREGVHALLIVTGIVSANIAIINLLPIPLFDGGNLLFVLIEGVRRRPVDAAVQQAAQFWSLIFLVLLAIVVLANDITRLLGAP